MIYDRIENLKNYSVPKAQAIMDFIAGNDCVNFPEGEHEIDGRNLFVRVMTYEPKPVEEGKFETHQVHADLQYIARGIELMQVTDPKNLTPTTDYAPKSDFRFYTATKGISDFVVQSGEFTVFYPGTPHRPSCLYKDNRSKVKKLVFKIRMI